MTTAALITPAPPTAEAAGHLDWGAAAPPALQAALGIRAIEIAGATCLSVAALPESRLMNHVIGLRGDVGADDLDAIAAYYAAAGCGHVVAVTPRAGGVGLIERLVARGYVPDYPWVTFAAVPARDWPAERELRAARITGTHRARFGEIVATGFGLPATFAPWIAALVGRPRWSCFVALAAGEPVAAGALYASGPTAWMTLGATLPEHRGRGAQALLIAARRAEARRLGCTSVISETGAWTEAGPNTSYRNLQRGGFTVVATRPNFRAPA